MTRGIPQFPCLSSGQLRARESVASKERKRESQERLSWIEAESSCILPAGTDIPYCCYTLLIRCVRSTPNSTGENDKGMDARRWVSLGAISEAAYHRHLMLPGLKINLP